jgi:hypothetical protein
MLLEERRARRGFDVEVKPVFGRLRDGVNIRARARDLGRRVPLIRGGFRLRWRVFSLHMT